MAKSRKQKGPNFTTRQNQNLSDQLKKDGSQVPGYNHQDPIDGTMLAGFTYQFRMPRYERYLGQTGIQEYILQQGQPQAPQGGINNHNNVTPTTPVSGRDTGGGNGNTRPPSGGDVAWDRRGSGKPKPKGKRNRLLGGPQLA